MQITCSIHRYVLPLLSLLIATQVGAAATTPLELQGTWEVTQVALDTKDQPHWRYEPNDPRILGRSLRLGADGEIVFNFQRELCDRVVWSSAPRSTLGVLIGKSFPRPPRAGLQRSPTLPDFELKFPDQTVTPFSAVCAGADASKGKAARWADAWFVSFGSEKLLVGYDSDTILVLVKTKVGAPTKPSFSCSGTLNVTESAICSSAALAGYDRSVAAAYKRSLKRRETESEIVKEEQRQWVTVRNNCKSDTSCLENQMRERLDVLMQD